MKRKNKIRFSSRANRNPEATGREKHRTGKKKKKGGRTAQGRRRRRGEEEDGGRHTIYECTRSGLLVAASFTVLYYK